MVVVVGGGLKACQDGLKHLIREELFKFKWTFALLILLWRLVIDVVMLVQLGGNKEVNEEMPVESKGGGCIGEGGP